MAGDRSENHLPDLIGWRPAGRGRRFRPPAEAPFALFAIARCAGWIAHAIEQGQTDTLIRPRARYVGPEPETVPPR